MIPGKVAIYVAQAPASVAYGGPDFPVRLVLVNGLGHSFAVAGACDGWLIASLATSTITSEPGDGLVACADHLVRPGTTRITRTVGTTYSSCSSDPVTPPDVADPECLGRHHQTIPPLPPGRYNLALDTTSIPHATIPAPATITIADPKRRP